MTDLEFLDFLIDKTNRQELIWVVEDRSIKAEKQGAKFFLETNSAFSLTVELEIEKETLNSPRKEIQNRLEALYRAAKDPKVKLLTS